MAANQIPESGQLQRVLGAKMVDGIDQKGTSVPISMLTKAQMQTALNNFATTDDAFNAARAALKAAYGDSISAASALDGFLNAARPVFISHFGYRWSADWAAAGWVNTTTGIPDKIEDRLGLAASVVTYLTANPSYEVAASGVTAQNGTLIRTLAINTETAVRDAKQTLKNAGIARTPTQQALVALMRRLIKNLAGMLAPDDPRWLAFGLQMPASNTTPGKPTGLTAQFDPNTGGMILTCNAQPFGNRFRFRARLAGSGLPYTLVASSRHPTARTKPMMGGTTWELLVQAANGSAQSVPSDTITFTVPLRPLATPSASVLASAPKRVVAARPKVARNGNGHGNGVLHRHG